MRLNHLSQFKKYLLTKTCEQKKWFYTKVIFLGFKNKKNQFNFNTTKTSLMTIYIYILIFDNKNDTIRETKSVSAYKKWGITYHGVY